MFHNLPASGGRKRSIWSTRTALVSLALHGLLLAGVVYASVRPPAVEEEAEEQVTFVELEEKPPEPPQVEAPPPPRTPLPIAPPIAKGFQELIPPDVPPPHIPPPNLAEPAVRAADFSGVGVAGGKADGVEGAPPSPTPAVDPGFAYEVGVLEAPPRLTNASQVQSLLSRLYPSMLRDAGIAGTTTLQFVITEEGRVDVPSIRVITSTHEPFAAASLRAVERFRFKPGRYQGQPVRVLIRMPIAWQPER